MEWIWRIHAYTFLLLQSQEGNNVCLILQLANVALISLHLPPYTNVNLYRIVARGGHAHCLLLHINQEKPSYSLCWFLNTFCVSLLVQKTYQNGHFFCQYGICTSHILLVKTLYSRWSYLERKYSPIQIVLHRRCRA